MNGYVQNVKFSCLMVLHLYVRISNLAQMGPFEWEASEGSMRIVHVFLNR